MVTRPAQSGLTSCQDSALMCIALAADNRLVLGSSMPTCRAQAAKTALRTVITPARARELAASHAAALPDLRAHVGALLVEGVLSEDYVLQVS